MEQIAKAKEDFEYLDKDGGICKFFVGESYRCVVKPSVVVFLDEHLNGFTIPSTLFGLYFRMIYEKSERIGDK